ncbi:MAG: hypothetical protein JOZ70_12420 [Pseudolabrys sp.]|nr:hypothetical protein [Pseudolabrys sp.]MBV9956041.1 hypothetical protein [Pseudolabrys sp.]
MPKRAVSIEIVEEDGASVIVRKFADGRVVREAVVPRTKTRKPKRPPLIVGRKPKVRPGKAKGATA